LLEKPDDFAETRHVCPCSGWICRDAASCGASRRRGAHSRNVRVILSWSIAEWCQRPDRGARAEPNRSRAPFACSSILLTARHISPTFGSNVEPAAIVLQIPPPEFASSAWRNRHPSSIS